MSATGTLGKLQFEIPRVEEIDPHEIASLRAELGALADTQPTEQLDALLQKRQSLINVLQRRLDAGELTYARYLATSQQVFSAGARQPARDRRGVREHQHDRRDLHRPTAGRTRRRRQRSQAAERERATLERRRDLRSTQRRKIAQLLAQNESALTALDRTTTALADAPIGKKPADADEAMAELEALADRAGNYAN